MDIPRSFGIRCLLVWVAALVAIGVVAFAVGTPSTSFTTLLPDGKLTWWQILVFSTTLSICGYYFALAPDRPDRRRDGTQTRSVDFVRGKGWIFLVGGVLLVLRSIIALLNG